MKKIISVLLAVLALASCKQVEMPFTHEDSEVVISSMLMWNLPFKNIDSSSKFLIKESVQATITQNEPDEVGEIVFGVPRSKRDLWDLTDVTLQATVPYDVYISPSLAGHWNLTLDDNDKPKVFLTVKSARTGFEKTYSVYAYIKSTD